MSSQSIVATNQQNLIVAQNNLQLQQLLMKNAISRSIDDPLLAEADVVPTSTMQIPEQEPVIPIQDLINDALQHRAELAESRIDLNSRNISDKAVRNALLPHSMPMPTMEAQALGEISHFPPAPEPRSVLATHRSRRHFRTQIPSATAAR